MKTDFFNIGHRSRRQFIQLLGFSTGLVTFGSIAKKTVAQSNSGYYYLKQQFSGKYICSGEMENGGKIWFWSPIPDGHESRYKFKLIDTGFDYYYLQHQFSGKYVCSGERKNGGKLWLFSPIPDGHEARYKFELSPVKA